jgi:predicted GTPase
MLRWKIRFAIVAVLILLPYVLLVIAGGIWLFERGYLTWFAIAATLTSFLGWYVDWLLRGKKLSSSDVQIKSLGAVGESAARVAIEEIAQKVEANPPPMNDLEGWKLVTIELFDAVAVQFGRTSDKPSLEITVPDAMLIAERVIHDLRLAAQEHIPGSHLLTIRQLEHLSHFWNRTAWLTSNTNPLRLGYRLLRFIANPVSGVFKEANDNLLMSLSGNALQEAQRWTVGYGVRRAGEYAIQLYSGQLAIHDSAFQKFRSPTSATDKTTADKAQNRVASEPLRVIVLGQAKAGKSSLVNAMFGELRAATDSLPCTTGITPYVLERDGMPSVILYDSEGFGGQNDRRAIEHLESELMSCDLVIMVCSAATAARAPDQRLLEELRQRYEANKLRSVPPVVVALSHIDHLRPLGEWNPPYDLRDEKSLKSRNISLAVETLKADLTVPTERIVPVCLRHGAVYNVTESLIPVVLEVLPDAERIRLLRLLREYHDAEYWSQLRRQAYNSGRLLVNAASHFAAPITKEVMRRVTGNQDPKNPR